MGSIFDQMMEQQRALHQNSVYGQGRASDYSGWNGLLPPGAQIQIPQDIYQGERFVPPSQPPGISREKLLLLTEQI